MSNHLNNPQLKKPTKEQDKGAEQMHKFIESAAEGVDILYAVQWLFDRLHPQQQEAALVYALDIAKRQEVTGSGNPGWIVEVNNDRITEHYPDHVQLVRVIHWLWLSVFEGGKGKYRDTKGRLIQLINVLNNLDEFYKLPKERQKLIYVAILHTTESHVDRLIRTDPDVPYLKEP